MKAILTFHSIDTSGSVLSYPPKAFASLLDELGNSGLPVLGLDELLLQETEKGITITFDDGMRSVFTAALPVLRDYAVAAHLFLTTYAIESNNQWPGQPRKAPEFDMLTWDEIERLHDAGVYIDSHTHSHPDMRRLSDGEMLDECEMADDLIGKRLGRRPQYFAYPYGYKNEAVCNYIRNRYQGAVTTEFRTLSSCEDGAQLPRLDSYYLQNHWLQRNLDSSLSRMYLAVRGTLRTLRGTQ